MLLTFLSTAFPATDSVELANGKTVHGVLSGRQSIYVTLTISEGQSKAEIRLNPDEIVRIHFSDSDQIYEPLSNTRPATPIKRLFS
jgi:translation initiation factor IF-1